MGMNLRTLALPALLSTAACIQVVSDDPTGPVTIDDLVRTPHRVGFTVGLSVTNHTDQPIYVYNQALGEDLDKPSEVFTLVMHEVPVPPPPGLIDCHVMIPNIVKLGANEQRDLAIAVSEQLATAAVLHVELGWSDRSLTLPSAELEAPTFCQAEAELAYQRLESGVASGTTAL
jgi:hypothetical protein